MSDSNARIGMVCLTILATASIIAAAIVQSNTGQPASALLTLAGSAIGGLAGTMSNGGGKLSPPPPR